MNTKPAMRLFLDQALSSGDELRLDDERTHYVSRVLRLKAGDRLLLFNNTGGEYAAVIREVSRREVVIRIGDFSGRSVESPLHITLVQAISRGERMDLVVQKATELGVQKIVPLITERSVVRLDGDKREKRALHWRKIAQSACEQCGRNELPLVDVPQSFRAWLEASPAGAGERLVLHPGASATLDVVQRPATAIVLLIGPEGGLSEAEYELAQAAGFSGCSMGPRILRTETAAIAAIAALQTRLGDLNSAGRHHEET